MNITTLKGSFMGASGNPKANTKMGNIIRFVNNQTKTKTDIMLSAKPMKIRYVKEMLSKCFFFSCLLMAL